MRVRFDPRDLQSLEGFCGLKIWEQPKNAVIYSIGADVSEGVSGDASCAQVLNCTTGILAASYWSNIIDPDNFAAELFKLGTYYNKAYLCVEVNNHGAAVISHLGGAIGGLAYPNLYKRIYFDEYTQKKTKQIGFKTTSSTKPRIIENLKGGFRDGEVIVYDKQTLAELGSFVRDDRTGRVGAKGKAKDDRVMALALAWEQARQLKENVRISESENSVKITYDETTGFPIFGG